MLELETAAGRLTRAGVLNPRREVTHLLAAARGQTPGNAWLSRDVPLTEHEYQRFEEMVAQRAAGVPFAYATGGVAFRTLSLRADPRALIPRPETEGLVELVLGRRRTGLAADIGTGTGCIALALAMEGSFDRIVAVERDAGAAALAAENVALVAPPVVVDVRRGDLLEPLAGERWHLIVSNPPYLTEAEYEALDASVREHEPRQALVSGVDGLAATRVLLAGAGRVLAPGGLLALEIDERRAVAVRALGREAGLSISIHDDLFGKPRYALAVRGEDVC